MYLDTENKSECFGCEGCEQVCPQSAIAMVEDEEGFRYPSIDKEKCIECGLCRKTCPQAFMPKKNEGNKFVFGGYNLDASIRFSSTSGGAFSAIVEAFCDEKYVIFGAEAKGIFVFHNFIKDKTELYKFRKSKYSQSVIGASFQNTGKFLNQGKKVIFSGTPCQIAGLLSYLDLKKINSENLLTVEVVCEGVPSPLYIRKLDKQIEKKYGSPIGSLDYRYTGKSFFSHGKWDFETMKIELKNKKKVIKKDRWFNPFWSVWLQHLISRPACYNCPFASKGRVADITLGDLWGVHIYCPELYGNNSGSSLIVCNTEKGRNVFQIAKKQMYGHELVFEDALKYQGPMRKAIPENEERAKCLNDLQSNMTYKEINQKWAKPLTLKLFFQKYIWGNRQKVFLWNLTHKKI